MPTVNDVLRQYAPEYLRRFGQAMPHPQRKVLEVLSRCRTSELGTVCYRCTKCQRTHLMGRSCGNRHCPTCQQDKAKAWLEKQTQRLLPCPYFLITFTVPAALRDLVRSHPGVCYEAMFAASSAALKDLAKDAKYVGSQNLGFFGVLHTWGRSLGYHPHIHYVVPGGGVNPQGDRWLPSRPNYFAPGFALAILFRAKFRAAVAAAGLLSKVDPAVWKQNWVVDSQAVGDGRWSLKYLAPYVFRVAISDRRIVSCGHGQVTFLYRKSGTRHWRKMTLDAMEFIRRFLQHVLPTGFRKVRHYGFLCGAGQTKIERVRWLITLHNGAWFILYSLVSAENSTVRPPVRCAECGAAMRVTAYLPPPVYWDTS